MGLKGFLQACRWEIGGLLLLLFCVCINLFPSGYIILGGDVLQALNLSENFKYFYYEDWFRQSFLFYGIFYFLDMLGVSDTGQLSWYLGIFLVGSYLSFLAFCSLLFPKSPKVARVLGALFYATNIYTLYIFTATWGYISYQTLYIFIPALVGLYIKVLETKQPLFVVLFFLAAFLASIGFSNPAFALGLGIFFFILTLLLFFTGFISFDWRAVSRITLLILGSVLLNAYWILPVIPQLRGGIEGVYASEFVDLKERLEKTSNAIFDTIRLMPTSEQNRYYPSNFPYPNISWMEDGILLLAFVPFFVVLFGFILRKEKREWVLYTIFLALFTVFVALVARIRFPFDAMNSFLFQLPGFNTLRGYDKLATFTPFLLSALLFLALLSLQGKRYYRTAMIGFFVVIVVLALPFYVGGIQTKLSYILSGQKEKDFRTAKQSALVKVPEAYYDVKPLLQEARDDSKIAMLPFSPGSSVGRVNFPAWKVNGPNIVKDLYGKRFIELYEYSIPGWMFAQDFENTRYDPEWIVDLYGLLGTKYIFYHKDAKKKALEEMEDSRRYLENVGALRLVRDTESFYLYTLEENRVVPYVYTSPSALVLDPTPEGLSRAVSDFRNRISSPEYHRKNPKELQVEIPDTLGIGSEIFLNEKYDPLWVAEYVSLQGEHIRIERDTSVKYANAWKTDRVVAGEDIEIYYLPFKFFRIGLVLSGLTLLVVVFGMVWVLRKKGDNV
ncbi:MAG: hypothetical protein A2808_01125 [Candidatus Moranbacteria bacterium RIFCSPHIGHO2_01_FULL_55_24]|nr:MAG: hypothetical protein A2808_01125 [Candidatus Moranbacteria bacterium RIFCSPHIGHO2_01_FULL_55_24]